MATWSYCEVQHLLELHPYQPELDQRETKLLWDLEFGREKSTQNTRQPAQFVRQGNNLSGPYLETGWTLNWKGLFTI